MGYGQEEMQVLAALTEWTATANDAATVRKVMAQHRCFANDNAMDGTMWMDEDHDDEEEEDEMEDPDLLEDSLRLEWIEFGVSDVEYLLQKMQQNQPETKITSLELAECSFVNEDALDLFVDKVLPLLRSSLRSFVLEDTLSRWANRGMTDDSDAHQIWTTQSLTLLQQVKTFKLLKGIQLHLPDLEEIKLLSLDLHGKGPLLEGILQQPRLQAFELYQCKMDETAWRFFRKGLVYNGRRSNSAAPSLRYLDLDGCGINDTGLKSLVQALISSPPPSFRTLDLSHNALTAASLPTLNRLLNECSTIECLILSGNQSLLADPSGNMPCHWNKQSAVDQFCDSAVLSPSLSYLDIKACCDTQGTATACLIEKLAGNSVGLKKLTVDVAPRSRAMKALLANLPRWESVQELALHLPRAQVDADGDTFMPGSEETRRGADDDCEREALLSALKRNSSLLAFQQSVVESTHEMEQKVHSHIRRNQLLLLNKELCRDSLPVETGLPTAFRAALHPPAATPLQRSMWPHLMQYLGKASPTDASPLFAFLQAKASL